MSPNSLPAFSTLPEKDLRGELLRTITRSLVGISIGFVLFSVFAAREIITRTLYIAAAIIFLSIIVSLLIRKGFIRLGGYILVLFLWITVSGAAFSGGGISAPIFMGHLVIILLASLLLGTNYGLWIAISTIIFGFFTIYADTAGFLPSPIPYSPIARLAIYAFFFLTAFVLQKASVNTTIRAITRADHSEKQYRSFLENISTVTYINDLSADSLTLYVSPQVEKVIEYTQKEFLEDPTLWSKIIHPLDRESVSAENQRTIKTGEPFNIDYRIITKAGKTIWVKDDALLIKNENNEPQYWLGVWTDITERKRSEQANEETVQILTMRTTQLMTASEVSTAAISILELNELLPRVVELIRSHFKYYYVGIFLTDSKNEVSILRAATGEMGKKMLEARHSLVIGNSSMIGWCIANNRARIALDVGKDAVHFKNPVLPLTRSELALPMRARGQVIGGMTIQSEKPSAFNDGDIKALQTMADQVANAIYTARLFDERSHLIKELEAKNAELERFTYTVSHDLKSPLVTIRAYLGYLKSDAQTNNFERFDKDLARIIKATETMQALLKDLLDLSRVGSIINTTERHSFEELVKDTLDVILSPLLAQKVKIKVQQDLPFIYCDKTRAIEVLQNLISNAIKFMGEQPDPQIQIGLNGIDPETGYPIFYIKDNGIGIERQYHEQVFGLFNRLNPQQTEGTGIGLALVKRIIEIHGGKIWVESEGKNKGSTFYFTLPNVK